MSIKYFLFKVRQDLKNLRQYPETSLRLDPTVNYDKYWQKRRRGNTAILTSWQKQRADHILRMVEAGDVVMDIGCGDGALLKYLMDKGGVKGIGVDMSKPILNQAKELGIKTHLLDLRDLGKLEELPEADFVLGLEILEHIPEPENLVIHLKSKVRKGMIYSFPNTGYYLHRLRLLSGRFPLQWIVHPAEHVRYWTATDTKWWVDSLGFDLDEIILYEGLPLLNKIFPRLFGQGIIIRIHDRK